MTASTLNIAVVFVGLLAYGVSVVMAVAVSQRISTNQTHRSRTLFWQALPYCLSLVAAMSFRDHGLLDVIGAAVIFLALTRVVLWGVKKQWDDKEPGSN